MKRLAAGRAASFKAIHPLLRPPAEAAHHLSEEGAARVNEDPELSPGFDSCGICAGPLAEECPVTCAACNSGTAERDDKPIAACSR